MKGGALGVLKTVTKSDLMKKNGAVLLPPSYGGVILTRLKGEEISKAIDGRPYFYMLSINCPCVDSISKVGKVKIGYSGAKAKFSLRLMDYIRYFGADSIKVHTIILFHYKQLAQRFETKIKNECALLHNWSGLVANPAKTKINKEWYSFSDKTTILNKIRDVRKDPTWNVKYVYKKKPGLRSGDSSDSDSD